MSSLKSYFRNFRSSDRGSSMVEYGLMVALVAVISVPAISMAGHKTEDTFDTVGQALAGGPVSASASTPDSGSDDAPPADDPAPADDTPTDDAPPDDDYDPAPDDSDEPGPSDDRDDADEEKQPEPAQMSDGESAIYEWKESKNGGKGEWQASFDFKNDWLNAQYLTLEITRTDEKGKTETTIVSGFLVPAGETAVFEVADNDLDINKDKVKGVLQVEVKIVAVSTTDAAGNEVDVTPADLQTRTVSAPTP